jgi:hypothetical protein
MGRAKDVVIVGPVGDGWVQSELFEARSDDRGWVNLVGPRCQVVGGHEERANQD